jgi:ribosomal protein S18 acetylase RimI-like enzyme
MGRMKRLSLRFASPGETDVALLVGMARAFHADDGHPLTPAGEQALRQLVAGDPLGCCWIVYEGEEPVGYAVLTLGFSVEYGGRDGFIDDLYLVRSARGRGLGRRVLSFLLDEARALGIRTLHLEVATENDPAARLYEALGFVATGRRLLSRDLVRGSGAAMPDSGKENPESS